MTAASLTPPSAVRLRDAEGFGLTRGRLRRAEWARLSQGLYGRPDAARPLPELARAMTEVLPGDSGFGHLTAAALRGWWLPNRLGRHVLLASSASGVHVQRAGVYVRRSRFTEVDVVDEVPLVTAPETLIALACDLTLVDLVPMVDCAIARGATTDEILAAARPRSRGSATLRRAVQLADPRSESWWESVLRLLHTVTGLGPVQCQVDVVADHGFVARADLHLVGTNRYPECDGGEHRTPGRHSRDLGRDKAMHRLGLERYGYTTDEIARAPHVIIRDAEDARGLRHDDRRVRRWWGLARTSSLTAYGRTRLAARLERYRIAANR